MASSEASPASAPGESRGKKAGGGQLDGVVVGPKGYLVPAAEYDSYLMQWGLRARPERDRSREQKWQTMLDEVPPGRRLNVNDSVVKRRLRKGVPDVLRARVWPILARTDDSVYKTRKYSDILQLSVDEATLLQINKDRVRTLQNHVMFKSDGKRDVDPSELTDGQAALFRVLKALATALPQYGYCQSMASPAAMFLTLLPEEDTFWTLYAVLTDMRYGTGPWGGNFTFGHIYMEGFPLLHEFLFIFEKSMAKVLPKLKTHLESLGYTPSIYLTRWFQTMFTGFPPELVLRLWDVFLAEGPKVMFRFAILLLKEKQKELLKSDFEGVAMTVQGLPDEAWLQDTDSVMERALDVGISQDMLERWHVKYHAALQESQAATGLAASSAGRSSLVSAGSGPSSPRGRANS